MHVHITCSVILSANIENKYGSNIAEATTATTPLITPSVVICCHQSHSIIPGPGPARYGLPPAIGEKQHDLRKWRAPAYSLSGITKPHKGTGVPGKCISTFALFNKTISIKI